jgi:hypothetical protein
MARQNRVTPAGEVIATPERGAFLGNRGVLHDDQGRIKRAWQLKRWIVCLLEFKGRRRAVMTPGRYTELFFLDEATALAAGHRPCAECRRERFNGFREAWLSGNPRIIGSQSPTAVLIDDCLHAERLAANRSKRLFTANVNELPDGVFIRRKEWGEGAYLLWDDRLLAWSPGGYRERRPRPKREEVLVLTPKSTVGAIQAGYIPEIHASANG